MSLTKKLNKSQIEAKNIQKKFSYTFSRSTDLFPSNVKIDVRTLYAFLRSADEFVDIKEKQNINGLKNFKKLTFNSLNGIPSKNNIIDDFTELSNRKDFEKSWIYDFFKSMEMDINKHTYKNFDELKIYTWGSAEVVGLMMARVLDLPKKADNSAILLGRAFQLANFIRDIGEDQHLKRIYIPQDEIQYFKLSDKLIIKNDIDKENFKRLIKLQVDRYFEISDKAHEGFKYLDIRSRIAIATADDKYRITLNKIKKDPMIVFKSKVKPSKNEFLQGALINIFVHSFKHLYEKTIS